jgi:hypothetical protein
MREIYLFIYFHTHTKRARVRVREGGVSLPDPLVRGAHGAHLVRLAARESGPNESKTGREIVIRNEYKFGRQLTDVEVDLLKELVTWRPGSSVVVDPAGAVVGYIAHPDDLDEFKSTLRKWKRRGKEYAEDEHSERAKTHPPLRLFVSIGDFLSKGSRDRDRD